MNLAAALAPFTGKYSAAFLRAMAFVLPSETEFEPGHYGDYSRVRTERDPADPGGATRYGIDARSHAGVHVDGLTLAEALRIYHDGEWADVRGDDLPPDVALCVFDAVINCGPRGLLWLQRAAGVAADGRIGPRTLAAVREAGCRTVCDGIQAAREHYYRQEVRPGLRARFLKGWLNRLAALDALLSADSPLPSAAPAVIHPAKLD